jgi:hypothetical protein
LGLLRDGDAPLYAMGRTRGQAAKRAVLHRVASDRVSFYYLLGWSLRWPREAGGGASFDSLMRFCRAAQRVLRAGFLSSHRLRRRGGVEANDGGGGMRITGMPAAWRRA